MEKIEKLLLRDEYLTLQVLWCVSLDNQTCMHEHGYNYKWVLWYLTVWQLYSICSSLSLVAALCLSSSRMVVTASILRLTRLLSNVRLLQSSRQTVRRIHKHVCAIVYIVATLVISAGTECAGLLSFLRPNARCW